MEQAHDVTASVSRLRSDRRSSDREDHSLLRLQRRIGNGAVQRMLQVQREQVIDDDVRITGAVTTEGAANVGGDLNVRSGVYSSSVDAGQDAHVGGDLTVGGEVNEYKTPKDDMEIGGLGGGTEGALEGAEVPPAN